MDIGVPVFAALDGKVISVQDGFFDREHGRDDLQIRQPTSRSCPSSLAGQRRQPVPVDDVPSPEDPDYDIVRYRYQWTVDGRSVRTVTSAALSDVPRRGIAQAGDRLAAR